MLRTSSLRIVYAAALLGCASEPMSDTSTASGSSSASESGASESGGASGSESGMNGSEDGVPQGCTVDSGCADDEFCDFPDDLCDEGQPGECAPRPDVCSDDPASECGCDGMVYTKNCANVMGVDTNQDASSCMAPAELFPCGPLLCDSSSFYCRRDVSDIGGEPDSYSCVPLPPCVGPVDCMCLANETCGFACEATGAGFTLTCPGG